MVERNRIADRLAQAVKAQLALPKNRKKGDTWRKSSPYRLYVAAEHELLQEVKSALWLVTHHRERLSDRPELIEEAIAEIGDAGAFLAMLIDVLECMRDEAGSPQSDERAIIQGAGL